MDPRWFQIIALSSLFALQQISSDFAINPLYLMMLFPLVLLTEKFVNKRQALHSAAITGISLALLLRATNIWLFLGAGILAMLSKKLIRFRDAHIFNPANFAITALLVFAPNAAWVASGVWGKYWLLVIIFCSYGLFLTQKVQRLDISVSFLLFYLGLHALRLLWLGDPFTLLGFRANSLALIVFSFFMISDPKTTPNARSGRILFSFLVAIVSFGIDAILFRRNGLFYALALASPLVIIINKFFQSQRFLWPAQHRSN